MMTIIHWILVMVFIQLMFWAPMLGCNQKLGGGMEVNTAQGLAL